MLEELGFTINENKVVEPCQELTFLGVKINTDKRTLALPDKKLNELRALVDKWALKRRATKLELQSLVCHLNWAAKVVRGGDAF